MLARLLAPTLVALAAVAPAASASDRAALQSTDLVSRAFDGGMPNGASVNPAISQDRRFARLIAFESDATNLVAGDTNGQRDVFVVQRDGSLGNNGSPWSVGSTTLLSRGADGQPADGASYGAAVDGSWAGTRGGQETSRPSCVAFVSAATNLVPGDTDGVADAFVSHGPGGSLEKVSQGGGGVTQVAVSGDCSRIAYVEGGRVRVKAGNRVADLGPGQDPSFAVGQTDDLVFGSSAGVKLSVNGTGRARTVAPGGSNPSYNDVKCRVVAYEKDGQVAFRKLGGDPNCAIGDGEHVASQNGGAPGNGRSRNPVVGNSGFYVTFTTDATNLGVNALGRAGDDNGTPDVYLYTDARRITLAQSVAEKGVPAGGDNGTMSYYANYVVFDSPAPIGAGDGPRQIYLRYLGPSSPRGLDCRPRCGPFACAASPSWAPVRSRCMSCAT